MKYNPDYIVRLTGDCPLADWEVIDNIIQFCLDGNLDYAVTDGNFPDGLDAEIMTMSALSEAKKKAVLPSEIEHVSQYIYTRGNRFKNGELESSRKLSHLRWTVDEPEDFVLVGKIYQALYDQNPLFLTNDILDLLRRQPELTRINDSFIRNEGLEKSIQQDKVFLKNV
jgi:spore coat polysaccharide biosynthesis protein SpsF